MFILRLTESVVEELCMFAEVVLLSTSPNNKQFRGEVLVKQPQSAAESFQSVREIDSKCHPSLPHLRSLTCAHPSGLRPQISGEDD